MGTYIRKDKNRLVFVKPRPTINVALGILLELIGVLFFLLLVLGFIYPNIEVTAPGMVMFPVLGTLFLFFGIRLTSTRWGQELDLNSSRMTRWKSNALGRTETVDDCSPIEDKELLLFMPKHHRYARFDIFLIGDDCEQHLFTSKQRSEADAFLSELEAHLRLPLRESIREFRSLAGYFKGDREFDFS